MKRALFSALIAMLWPGLAYANEAQAVIERHSAAYHSRDMAAFLATYAPDAEIYLDGASQPLRGHAQIRLAYSLNFAPDAPATRIESRVVDGNRVIDQESYDFGDGQVLCCSIAEYVVSGGLIRKAFLVSPR